MYIQERLYFYNFLLENLLKKIFNNLALSGFDMCKLPKNTKGIKHIATPIFPVTNVTSTIIKKRTVVTIPKFFTNLLFIFLTFLRLLYF